MDPTTAALAEYISNLTPTDIECRQAIRDFIHAGADTTITFKNLTTLEPSTPQLEESLKDQQNDSGSSLLHLAASRGNFECVQTLLQEAHLSWNILDSNNVSIGEVAKKAGFDSLYDRLVDEGVRTEFLLFVLGQRVVEDVVSNASYLTRKLIYSDGRLLDSDGNAVMMGWEAPLMLKHAQAILPKPGLDVLNVGFGLGIIDEYLQELHPASHTIIEAHPDVYQHMIDKGWDKKPGVRILFGRWQDVLENLETYDGIFFDTFGEYYDDLKDFHQVLPNHLREETGIYSFFNGLAGTNQFFHDVSCKMAQLDLAEIGLSTEFVELSVSELGDDVWQNTKRAYWSLPIYRLPISRIEL
ncbi:hypothetical protein BATDEDRAFT_19880 [Batrachochytrium dendrobatidis JAM81]|uniref:Arginine N-methyltransferase 2 n=1 Tax=Batrachochytrium dendrobatidis (strain JAM81 / FGSC 10211) TaxID=684364 RepID=F4P503_BATDJ|nr:protein-arginine N5-methyltransferase [Batrachochytrium dendrobatidis JAM81]EGF79789.1 hypothetical protein BATDEDRAFT_19880 [Batrachochytrium dendrobatidis JAM81]|eukprot:XP_006679402.1 hypothetical protein BATDEDRAFT_19880 [Batrachochytrium dendrobatidis JAM81]